MKQTLPTVFSALLSKISSFKKSSPLVVILLLVSGNILGQSTQTFSYTGTTQTFTIPAGVTSITVTATGAAGGGTGSNANKGGMGASITGTFTVTPGHIFNILVGGLGTTAGSYGGGGGGGTFVSNSTTSTLLIAGGGGGGGSYSSTSGKVASVTTTPTSTATGGGAAGTGTLGGNASTTTTEGGGGSGYTGNGTSNLGGGGGIAPPTATGGAGSGSGTAGGFGGGGGGGANGGGGGGGYAGGGGGKVSVGGGGGSSYNTGTSPSTSATNTGNGSVTITYTLTTNTWTGTTSTDWNTATNWSLGTVPTSGNNVVIATAANQPIIGAAASCGSLTLNSSSTLVINSALAVGANWTNNSSASAVSGTGTVTMSGTTIGGTFATTFPNLTITGGTTTNTITGTSVTGTCSVTSGAFILSNQNVGGIVLTLNFKDFSLTGTGVVYTTKGTLTGTATNMNITGSYSQSIGTTFNNYSGYGFGKIIFTGGGNTSYSNYYTTATLNWLYTIIQVSNNTSLTLNNNLISYGVTGTTLTIDSGSSLIAGTNSVLAGGASQTWSILGTIKTANTIGLSGATTTTLVSTNSPTITLGTLSTIEYNASGAQTVTERTDYANVTLSGSGIKTFTATPTIAGKLSLQGTATTASATPTYGASATLEYKGSAAQTTGVEFPATFSGSGGVIINNANGVTLVASKAISSGLTLTSGAFASGAYTLTYSGTGSSITRTSGTLDISNASGGLTFTNATTALTLPASLFTGNVKNLTMNGTGGVTLNNAVTLSGTLTLTSGKLTTTSSNLLTISNSATSAVSGGSSSSYINGPIALTLSASLASGSTYVFPVGKGTYNPFSLVNPTTTSGGTVTVNSEVFDSNAGGSAGIGLSSINTNRYWASSITSGSANFTNTLVKLSDALVVVSSAVTSSSTLTGTYDIVGGNTPTIALGTSVTSVATEATTLPGYYVLGSFPLAMSYTSSTATQGVTSTIYSGITNQQIIGMQVVTSGNTSPLDATSFTINTTGTTAVATDINNAKIWYTGTSSTFATTNQFGSTVATPNGSHTITGTQTLAEGTNYFWLTYDIPSSAVMNNVVDAEFTSVTVGGTAQTPTITAPTGSRTIKPILKGTYTVGSGGNYTSLTAANGLFASINTYGLADNVTVNIISDITIEDGTNALNQWSELGTGGYTLKINPIGAARIVSGSSTAALIKLNGADRVTIDGSIGGSGTDKSLTITNTNTATSGNGVIWIASASASDGATNNTVKNCIITGQATTTTQFGIFSGGTSAMSTTGNALKQNTNTVLTNNLISKIQYGIFSIGFNSSNLTSGVTISNNTIGTTTSGDGFSAFGIFASLLSSGSITGNSVQNNQNTGSFGFAPVGSTVFNSGIYLQNSTGSSVSKNAVFNMNIAGSSIIRVFAISAESPSFSTVGAPSQNTIDNNLVYNVKYTGSGSSTWQISAINANGGYGDKFYYNSVYMPGNTGSSTSGPNAAFSNGNASTTTATNNIDVRNNIFAVSGTATVGTYYAHYSKLTTITGSTVNYNDLYLNVTGGATSTYGLFNSTSYSTFANWQVTGFDANSISADPLFTSPTDLRPGLSSPVGAAGITGTGITTDYLGTSRGIPPTIGAYETLVDAAGPVITYTVLANTYLTTNRALSSVTIIDASGVNTTAGTLPRLYYKKSTSANTFVGNTSADNGWKYVEANGSSSPFDFTIDYSLLAGGSVSVSDIIQYFVVAQDLAATPNISINSGTFAATPASVALTSGAFPITGTINQYSITGSISGTITVPGTYPSLTLAGGAFEAINNATVTGNITIQIAGDLTLEIGTNALNAFASPYTVTIQPTGGVLRTISGSASGAVIKLNGADRVTIDGLNTGGNALTISNLSTAATTAVIWNASLGAGAGAITNTIKNCTLSNGSSAVLNFGIAVSGATIGSNGADNDDITIQGNSISSCATGIYAIGTASVSSGGLDNLNINNNSVTTNTSVTSVGIQLGNALNASISQNTLDIQQSYNGSPVGISLETGFNTSTVTKNKIVRSFYTGIDGYGGRGITIGTASATSAITISNNIIYGVNGDNYTAFGNSSSMGIAIGTIGGSSTITTVAGGINLYNNSVNMYGSYSNTSACLTAALYIGSAASALDIKNNIFVNSLNNTDVTTSTSKAYAIYSAAANTAFTTINYNDYYVSGSQGVLGNIAATDRTNLAGIVSGFGGNANSISAIPTFISATNLHLSPVATTAGNAALKAGTYISSVLTDYDGETRNVTVPAIGADEIFINGFWTGATSTVWDESVTGNWDDGTLPASGADIVVPAGVTNSPVLTSVSPTIGKLNLGTGKTLTLGANTLTINGAVTGTGTLTGSSTSNLTIAGTAGTLNFTNGSRALNNLSLGASGVATLGSALDIYGTVGFTTGGSLNLDAKAVTLKSTDSATARVSDLTGSTLTGATNVTVERYIPNRRAWRALTAPLKGSVSSVFSQWQNNGNSTLTGVGVELWGPGGTGSTGNGLAVGPNNSILQYDNSVAGAWTPVTNTKNTNLFTTGGNNAFMLFPTGGYGSNNIAGTTTAAATTLKATGQLITGQVPYTNLSNTSHTLIGNPYASPIDLNSILDASTTLQKYFWVWDPNGSNQGAYNTFDALANTFTSTDLSYSNSTVIQSGQAFFVKALTGQTGSFTINENNKSNATVTNVFRNGTTPELFRVGLYKQVNNEWAGRDGAMTVILQDADANQTPNKMANGTENIVFTKNGGNFASNHHLPLVATDVLNVKVWNTSAGANYKLKINTEQFTTTNLDATLEDLFTNARTPLALDGTAVEYPFSVTTDALSTGDRFRIVFQTSTLGTTIPTATNFSIVPNPVTGDSFQVNLGSLATGTYSYSICNAIGQEVEKGSIDNAAQNTNYTVKFRETAATGIYIMKIKGSDNSVFTAKLIKK